MNHRSIGISEALNGGSAVLPPGPRAPAWLQLTTFLRDPYGYPDRCRQRYGDWFTVKMTFIGTVVFTSDPAAVREIVTGDPDLFRAGDARAAHLEPLVGSRSVLVLEGEEHTRERRRLSPIFHPRAIKAYEGLIEAATHDVLMRWPNGGRLRVRSLLEALTLEVGLRVCLGIEDPAHLARLARAVDRLLNAQVTLMLPGLQRDFGPYSPWRRFLRYRREVDELILGVVRHAQRDGAISTDSVLARLLASRDEAALDETLIRDHLVTVLFAGREAMAITLAWTFDLILRDSAILRRAVDAADRCDSAFLEALIKETMRLRPVIGEFGRELSRPVDVGPWRLPAGMTLAVSISAVHHRPLTHERPLQFDPDRFTSGKVGAHTWIPFGSGPRACPGASYSVFEMTSILGVILREVTFTPLDRRAQPARYRGLAIIPQRGTPVRLIRRREAPCT